MGSPVLESSAVSPVSSGGWSVVAAPPELPSAAVVPSAGSSVVVDPSSVEPSPMPEGSMPSEPLPAGSPHADPTSAPANDHCNHRLDTITVLPDLGDLRGTCGAMAGFKHPRRLVLVDELPTNASGKVDKRAVREAVAAGDGP